MKSALRPYHQAIVLALILLIHGSILMLFIVMEFQSAGKHEATVMMEEEQPHMTERDWVALNNTLPNTQMVAQEAAEHPQEQPEVFEKPHESQAIEQHEAVQEEKKQEIVAQEEEIDEAIALASQFLELKKPVEEAPPEEKKEEPLQEQRHPITQITDTPTPSRQTPSFAQLAQGFVEHLQQADMTVQSNRSGTASIDQIKHINYCQKIIGCVVNSYKISNHTAPHKGILAQRARLHLALNSNGTIASLTLQQSSGDNSVDRFLLDMFKDASSSFPPIPAAIKENPYHLPTFSIDSLESFHSTRGWYIDNKSA